MHIQMRLSQAPKRSTRNIFDLESVGFDDGTACRYTKTRFLTACAQDGWTALMLAAGNGHAPVVQALLDTGAAVDLAKEVRNCSQFISVEGEQPLGGYMLV